MKIKWPLIVLSIIVVLFFICFAVYSVFQKSASTELNKKESEEEQKVTSEIKLSPGKIDEENIYIVEDKLNILKSKKDAEVYIEKAFSYLLQDRYKFHDILIKKEGYSVQLFTKNDGTKDIVYLNFLFLIIKLIILIHSKSSFGMEERIFGILRMIFKKMNSMIFG